MLVHHKEYVHLLNHMPTVYFNGGYQTRESPVKIVLDEFITTKYG